MNYTLNWNSKILIHLLFIFKLTFSVGKTTIIKRYAGGELTFNNLFIEATQIL